VRQQNTGAVEDYILLYSTVYLRMQKWKNYWNRSTFANVIVKIKVAPFFMAHGVCILQFQHFERSLDVYIADNVSQIVNLKAINRCI